MKKLKSFFRKSLAVFLLAWCCGIAVNGFTQPENATAIRHQPIPEMLIKDYSGVNFNTEELIPAEGQLRLLVFWDSCCRNGILALSDIQEFYEDWKDTLPIEVYAISVDDSRSSSKIRALADGNGWEFPVLLDENSDFKRAMNVTINPHIMIIDGKQNIVWEIVTYSPGIADQINEFLVNYHN